MPALLRPLPERLSRAEARLSVECMETAVGDGVVSDRSRWVTSGDSTLAQRTRLTLLAPNRSGWRVLLCPQSTVEFVAALDGPDYCLPVSREPGHQLGHRHRLVLESSSP